VNFKLNYRIHRQRQHQQRIVVALVGKYFMWIVGDHCGTKIVFPADSADAADRLATHNTN